MDGTGDLRCELKHFLSVHIQPVLQLALVREKTAIAVLFPVKKATRIGEVVGSHQNAVALSLVSHEEAFIALAVWPCVYTEATCLAVDPLTREDATIGPLIGAKARDFVVKPGAFIGGTIWPLVDPVPVLLVV